MTRQEAIKKSEEMFRDSGSIDIAKIVDNQGIELVGVTDEDKFDASIEFDKSKDKFVIKANLNHSWNRIKFSIAHELAHFILHKDLIEKQGVLTRSTHIHLNPQEERQANILASEILMPEILVREVCGQFHIEEDDVIPTEIINKLSHIFEVSRQAMAIRLEQIGYVIPFTTYVSAR